LKKIKEEEKVVKSLTQGYKPRRNHRGNEDESEDAKYEIPKLKTYIDCTKKNTQFFSNIEPDIIFDEIIEFFEH
jgi:hypothetical protein